MRALMALLWLPCWDRLSGASMEGGDCLGAPAVVQVTAARTLQVVKEGREVMYSLMDDRWHVREKGNQE